MWLKVFVSLCLRVKLFHFPVFPGSIFDESNHNKILKLWRYTIDEKHERLYCRR
jgi:hypothetical protein